MSDKNMADVADKAVDKLAGGIEAVAKAVEKVAPHVWEILVRQARVAGVTELATLAFSFCIFAILVVLARRLANQTVERRVRGEMEKMRRGFMDSTNDDCPTAAFPFLLAALALAPFLVVRVFWYMPESIQKIATPEYFAAQELIRAAK
jgi:hypothetical protein